jgi:phosphinothricin acetyltransferase
MADPPAVTEIYNQGIEDRVGVFQAEPRPVAEIEGWFDHAKASVVVEDAQGQVLGYAEIGVHRNHVKLDGEWLDCVMVEPLIPENID